MMEEGRKRDDVRKRCVEEKRNEKVKLYFSFFSNEQQREETEEDDMTRKSGGGCYVIRVRDWWRSVGQSCQLFSRFIGRFREEKNIRAPEKKIFRLECIAFMKM
jgi:hypothetical protein